MWLLTNAKVHLDTYYRKYSDLRSSSSMHTVAIRGYNVSPLSVDEDRLTVKHSSSSSERIGTEKQCTMSLSSNPSDDAVVV